MDNALLSNSPEYYRVIADYDGVVSKAAHSMVGLNTENLRGWYLKRCEEFFYIKGGLFWAKRIKVARADCGVRLERQLSLVYRMTSNLYVIRSMRKVEAQLTEYYDRELNHLQKLYQKGYARALDKNLYLAERLKSLTVHIQHDEDILKEARLGSIWMPNRKFSPTNSSLDSPFHFGETLAVTQHFRQVLGQFDQSIRQSKEVSASVSRGTLATLKPTIEIVDVRGLLSSVGMGSIYNKAGEWTAALRALAVVGILRGNGREVARWAENEQYVHSRSIETIRRAWEGDGLNQAEQCKNDNEAAIFRLVEQKARILLNRSVLHS